MLSDVFHVHTGKCQVRTFLDFTLSDVKYAHYQKFKDLYFSAFSLSCGIFFVFFFVPMQTPFSNVTFFLFLFFVSCFFVHLLQENKTAIFFFLQSLSGFFFLVLFLKVSVLFIASGRKKKLFRMIST